MADGEEGQILINSSHGLLSDTTDRDELFIEIHEYVEESPVEYRTHIEGL